MPATTRRRADAERNIEAILDAALRCFARDPGASMTEIAKAAGVGRVTLYGHFASREDLLEALFTRSLADAGAALDAADLGAGPADQALARAVRSSWRVLDRYRTLLAAGLRILGPAGVRARHGDVLARVEDVIERGRAEGAFGTAVPAGWQAGVVYALMHAAAEEVDGGRLAAGEAADALVTTVMGALAAGTGPGGG
ncbi:TetR/AcrR family transcriptional regulator [Actinomadura geliboluensis]|jgi:AcrR family transcriptional regulator|uniref:TetR/AcrR family transcriptional regulator n=1 Tax=Actinomadura geliboluensis TaxID=882440 RepID=A0A5S4GDE9_9ACTN|nr:TetR/AcrR family transcriptional regulator [Actinomadura geliboluensis]TMR30889.1 TetR/AcrR family transcriptional regulator [Actinomadura geliboluensis]